MMVAKLVSAILIQICLWVLLVSSSLTRATESSDMNCLRSIKSQLKDPNGRLSSWVFGNHTKRIRKFDGVSLWNTDEDRVIDIDLGGFGLEGEFPSGVKECSSLQGLNLSRNNLSGALPPHISSFLPFLVTLDLSDNRFSGEIPASFSEIVFLNTLLLDRNQFTGRIPPTLALLERLLRFSVSYNHLKGPIPRFTYAYITRSSFSHNPGLSGLPRDPRSDLPLFSLAIITAACAAAVCFPLGAAIGWFCVRLPLFQ